jgi:hypothetical protein
MTRLYCWAMSHILTRTSSNLPEVIGYIIIHILPHMGHNHTGIGV